MRMPSSGRSRSKRSRMRRSTGISRSAHSMRRTPSAARPRSVTSWAGSAKPPWQWAGVMTLGSPCGRRGGGTAPKARPRRPEPMDQPLFEANVFLVAQAAIRLQRGRIVRADVEDDLVAEAQQFCRDGAGRGGGEAAAAVVGVREHVADDRQAPQRADDVRAGRCDEAAADPDAVVDAVVDRRRGQPRGEAQLVEAIELADLHRQQARDLARVGPEVRLVDPHPDHRRAGVHAVLRRDRRQLLRQRGDVRGARPDQVAQHPLDAVVVAHHEQRLRREAGVFEDDRGQLVAGPRRAPARPARTRGPRESHSA